MGENIIEVSNLTKTYGDFNAVKDMSFTIKKGGIYGLIGENGAGKTTLIRMLAGLIAKTSGTISFYGNSDEKSLTEARKKFSFIVETPYHIPSLTAYENLNLQRLQRGIKDKSSIDRVLKLVNLENTGKKTADKFSLGMRQRLGIAIAMLEQVDVLVLDEPINGLDPQGIIEMRNLIKKLNTELGVTIIISSHILSELSLTVTDYIFMSKGHLIKQTNYNDLMKECDVKFTLDTSNNKKAEAVLKKLGNSYKTQDNKLCILGKPHIPTISKELHSNGIYIYELFESTMTLEQYYISLMEATKK